jgi:hypothetical protein
VEGAAVHIAHDLYLLRHAWVDRELRIGWTLWFITARALMDFFFVYARNKNKQGQSSDDILAADFLATGVWQPMAERLATEQPPDYAACRRVANKLSAHLTYSRTDLAATGPTGPSLAVHDYLLGVAGMWLDALSPERRAWFAEWFPIHAPDAEGHPKTES